MGGGGGGKVVKDSAMKKTDNAPVPEVLKHYCGASDKDSS